MDMAGCDVAAGRAPATRWIVEVGGGVNVSEYETGFGQLIVRNDEDTARPEGEAAGFANLCAQVADAGEHVFLARKEYLKATEHLQQREEVFGKISEALFHVMSEIRQATAIAARGSDLPPRSPRLNDG